MMLDDVVFYKIYIIKHFVSHPHNPIEKCIQIKDNSSAAI